VGVEITITRLAAKCKLSQNKEARDRQGAVDALHAHRNHALAEAIATTLEPR
jgi:transcriptional regulator